MRALTMEQECREHFEGPAWRRRSSLRRKWAYSPSAWARFLRSRT